MSYHPMIFSLDIRILETRRGLNVLHYSLLPSILKVIVVSKSIFYYYGSNWGSAWNTKRKSPTTPKGDPTLRWRCMICEFQSHLHSYWISTLCTWFLLDGYTLWDPTFFLGHLTTPSSMCHVHIGFHFHLTFLVLVYCFDQ